MSAHEHNGGGPAFPCAVKTGKITEHVDIESRSITEVAEYAHLPGMSLRDWFAVQALAGLLYSGPAGDEFGAKHFAIAAYAQADAMLAERSRKEAAK